MKAILRTTYGPPEELQLAEVALPVPTAKQILVKVRAVSLNALEWRGFMGTPFFIRLVLGAPFKPKDPRFGTDVSGVVEAVGSEVTEFKVGDEVFGVAPGALAEYVCNGASKFALKPAHVSFEAAAAIPVAGFTALQGLRDTGEIKAGQKVLVYGASGGVGMFAVQLAKAFGAQVTAVCSTRNVELVRAFGAETVFDYQHEDFTKHAQQYDLIFAVNGHHAISTYRRMLTPTGRCVVAGGAFGQVLPALFLGKLISKVGRQKHLFMGIASTSKKDLLVLKEFLAEGKLKPVLDRSYLLSETPQALRYLMETHAQGKVIIVVQPAS